jgi:hypothetical protein
MSEQAPCPDAARWKELLGGSLPEADQAALNGHLEGCRHCQQTLEGLAAGSEVWAGAARHLARGRPGDEAALRRVVADLEADADPPAASTSPGPGAEGALDFLSPPEKPGQLGRLGHYEVLEVIGRGGMGIVLKAMDAKLQRVVAIKVMAPQLAASAGARKRFRREAQAAAAVRDEHVIDIHAVEEANGLPYLVMEYVAGRSLQERLDQTGPLGLKEVLRIGMQAAAGLAAAHAQGLVHRDVKPANILLENGIERVKITDFGLARAADDAGLTQSGVIAGTPLYMAPEQALGEAVDHRSDLFSLGSVLYTCCAGRPPFAATTTRGVLRRVCEARPRPLREVNPEVPEWLAEALARLLARDPARRFQSAAEVAELLKQRLAELQQPAPAAGKPPAARRQRRRTAAALVLLLALAGLGLAEATGMTGVARTVIRAWTPAGSPPTPPPANPSPPALPPAPAASWPETVAALPADEQVKAVVARLQELNPGFDGLAVPSVTGDGVVWKLELRADELTDISPVRALAGLKGLECRSEKSGKLADLSPLKGLLLRGLDCRNTQVADLSPLQGMLLDNLALSGTHVSDLTPLTGMPLTSLQLGNTPVEDLTPLKGMPLKMLYVDRTRVKDLSPVAGAPLEHLVVADTSVADLSPLSGMPLKTLSCRNTAVRDLSPLRGMPLESLICARSRVLDRDVVRQNVDVLRSLKSLTTVNRQPAEEFLKRAERVP